jgi:glycosyltransferase involved in cell wall biosynthesis
MSLTKIIINNNDENDKIHIVMCSWKRLFNLKKIVNSLFVQSFSKKIHFHILNNNINDKNELEKCISTFRVPFNIDVKHYDNKHFCFERYFYIRDVIIEKYNAQFVIIIDDDQTFPSSWVEKMYSIKQCKTLKTWHCRKYYSNYNYCCYLKNGETFNYGVLGGCIIDTSIFKKDSLFWNIPNDLPNGLNICLFDDYWLSYVISYIYKNDGWSIQKYCIEKYGFKPLSIDTKESLNVSLCKLLSNNKKEVFMYLRDNMGWFNNKIVKEEVVKEEVVKEEVVKEEVVKKDVVKKEVVNQNITIDISEEKIQCRNYLINIDGNMNVNHCGYTIWLSNLCNSLTKEGYTIDILTKECITNDTVKRNIIDVDNVSFVYNKNPVDYIDTNYGKYDTIIIRNHYIFNKIHMKNWLHKTCIYGLDVGLSGIKGLQNKFKELWTQSDKLKQLFIENGVQENKIKITEPIAWKYDFKLPERNDNEIRLIYCGTLRNEENILEIIEEFKKIHQERPEVLLKIVYGKIHGNKEFIDKVNKYIKEGVDGCEFKYNLSHKDACYEIATSDIGICWRKEGWGENGEVSTKVKEYDTYGICVCYTLNSNINNILNKYKIHTYVLAYDDYERTIFKNNLIYDLKYQFINGNYNDKIAEDIINENVNVNKNDFFINSIYSNSKIKFNNQYGHVNAMISILNDAIKNNYENILILEYDVHFHVILPSILNNTIDKLNNYPIMYLGASKHNNCIIDHNKKIYEGMTGTFAIILNKCVFNDFKDKLEQKLYPSDFCLIKVCEKHKPYIGETDCIISNIEYSSIRNLYYDNDSVYKKFNWVKKYYYFAKREMRLGIIVCFRNRYKDLSYFLQALKNILKSINYKIIIVNQDNDNLFGRGILFNIGYLLIQNKVDYIVCHDVDLIPFDNYYNYDGVNKIKHLSKYVSQFKYLVPYDEIFGGVEYFDNKTFEFLDGFHNLIQGRGAEDDFMCKIIKNKNLDIHRPECYFISLPQFSPNLDTISDTNKRDFTIARKKALEILNYNLNKLNNCGLKSIINNDFKVKINNFNYIDNNVIFVNVDFEKSYDEDKHFNYQNKLNKNYIEKILNTFRFKYKLDNIFSMESTSIIPSLDFIKTNYEPFISCILPVYNGFPSLETSINSILNQSFKFFELIIVNDGSTDETDKYLSSLKDERIIYIKKDNDKLPAALNTGLKKCRGKYITWTSHDNYYEKDAFIQFYTALESYSEIDFVYSSHKFFGDKNNIIEAQPMTVLEMLLRFPGICGFMWTKKILDRIGLFDTNLNGIEDYDYWTRILLENPKFLGIKKVLYHYKVHNNSMSSELSKKKMYFDLDKKVAVKIKNKYPNMLDINTFFPFLKYCYDIKSKSIAYYLLGLNIINTTRSGFKEVFYKETIYYFKKSYELDNSFTPSLINIILCCKMNNENYDIYLKDIQENSFNFDIHNSFIKKKNINIKKLLSDDINIDNLYVKLIKYDVSCTNFEIKRLEFVNSYLINDAIKTSNHFNIAIVPSDPLSAYEKKRRSHTIQEYYNPNNFFSKVNLFSPRETESFFNYGINCYGKIDKSQLQSMCCKYKIDLIRGWGSYWPVDYIMNLTKIPKIISAHDTRETFIYDNLNQIDYIIPYSQSVGDAIIEKFLKIDTQIGTSISNKFYMLYNSVDENIFKPINKNHETIIEIRKKV